MGGRNHDDSKIRKIPYVGVKGNYHNTEKSVCGRERVKVTIVEYLNVTVNNLKHLSGNNTRFELMLASNTHP